MSTLAKKTVVATGTYWVIGTTTTSAIAGTGALRRRWGSSKRACDSPHVFTDANAHASTLSGSAAGGTDRDLAAATPYPARCRMPCGPVALPGRWLARSPKAAVFSCHKCGFVQSRVAVGCCATYIWNRFRSNTGMKYIETSNTGAARPVVLRERRAGRKCNSAQNERADPLPRWPRDSYPRSTRIPGATTRRGSRHRTAADRPVRRPTPSAASISRVRTSPWTSRTPFQTPSF